MNFDRDPEQEARAVEAAAIAHAMMQSLTSPSFALYQLEKRVSKLVDLATAGATNAMEGGQFKEAQEFIAQASYQSSLLYSTRLAFIDRMKTAQDLVAEADDSTGYSDGGAKDVSAALSDALDEAEADLSEDTSNDEEEG